MRESDVMTEYQADVIVGGSAAVSVRGTLIECAEWADQYIHSHDGCESVRIYEIGNGEDD